MELKRYTNTELIELTTNIFYDYLSNDSEGVPNVNEVLKRYTDRIKLYKNRIKMYEEALTSGNLEKEAVESLKEQLQYLHETLPHLENSNIKYQKELYEKTHSPNFCRSVLRIPLNKEINSFYDDLILEVLFYDDVCTPIGKISEYNQLTSKEERKQFLKQNTEITHISFVFAPQGKTKAVLAIKGKLNFKEKRIKECGIDLLPSKFSDFSNLRLSDINELDNNDLKQFLQEKIDLDKENMEKLSSQIIRGDLYEIFKNPETNDFYIRYICRSTGRIYYNRLNLRNLMISKYFNENDFNSYARAWWNLNTLGGNPDGEPVIRC